MRLTEPLENEIRQVYEAYWDSYFSGNEEMFASLIDDDFSMIGAAETEVCRNKSEGLEFFKSSTNDITGKASFKNRDIRILPVDSLVLVNEMSDAYILIDKDWQFYSKVRLSTLLRKNASGWKVLQQHGSFPDARVEGSETAAFEKITKENIALRDAVKQSTIELEHKNRELEIEASLERVRVVAMGMQKPEDLLNICEILFKELEALGFKKLRNALIHTFNDEEKYFFDYDYSDFTGGFISRIPYTGHPAIDKFIKEIRSANDAFTEIVISGKELEDWKEFRKVNNEADDARLDSYPALYYYFYSIGPGDIGISTFASITGDNREVLKRFRNVFDFAYKRYADVAQAEAQAREAQIEAALEKVRSKTMAMHESAELEYVIKEATNQLLQLGFKFDSANFSINLDIHNNPDMHLWLGVPGSQEYFKKIIIPYFDHPMFTRTYDAIDKGKELITDSFSREEKDSFYKYIYEHTESDHIPQARKDFVLNAKGMARSTVISKNSALTIINYATIAYSEEENAILKRLVHVFDQAYTRFLDLQKAEAQAREAKIEASLERVRARAMAMHQSDELDEVLAVLFDQFDILGIPSVSAHITLIDLKNNTFTFRETGKGGHRSYGEQTVLIDSMDIWKEAANKWKASEPLALNKLHFPKESLPQVWQVFHESFASMPDDAKIVPDDYPDGIYHTAGNCKFGYIGMNQVRKATEEEEQIVLKFSTEFGRLYQRFLDLQKAEAQAKESRIQLALERVRAKTIAMQKSDELLEVINVVAEQLVQLGFKFDNVSLGINNKNYDIDFWMAAKGQSRPLQIHSPYIDNPLINRIIDARKNGLDFFADTCTFEENRAWIKHTIKNAGENVFSEPTKQFLLNSPGYSRSTALMENINFFIGNYAAIPYTEEENNIFKRFANVIGQSYTRFLDLQKAEAQTKEAKIEASLERVRSRTLAMHKSEELSDAATVVFKQLIGLGINPSRLYIGIIKDDSGEIDYWITDEHGTKVTKQFTGHADRNEAIKKTFDGWLEKRKTLIIEMKDEELQRYFHYLNEELKVSFEDMLSQKRRVQNIAYFGNGFIGIASPEDQPAETLQLLERFAAVFNLTYTRFNDLKLAEANAIQAEEDLTKLQTEKRRAEEALKGLRAAQAQLIQSEKMASLGELTAGIAHEIQNPLNFVNNFSEINKELLFEMEEEIAKGNYEGAKAIAKDVTTNQEKINFHGKRADAIVKGMLQHSRKGSGQKELTDINDLADEYLRLAYHGLKAKDKSFNAKFETDFDPTLEKINVLPQDIGRVILNLINNAFYAASQGPSGIKDPQKKHEPSVWVSTKKAGDNVLISVRDNGPGIPAKVLDKIFQPFFTTKPTGQGTGLGLSLSYDIITEGHGGELTVETRLGEGSEFIVSLPR